LSKISLLEFLHPSAQQYAQRFTTEEEVLLAKINRDTYAQHPQAHMLSGHVQGKFLQLISTVLKPRRILEIGTFTGYSALCLAGGLIPDGQLHTIELRETDGATAQKNFNESSCRDKIHLHIGNAMDIIPQLNEIWDLVFIDADKTGYLDYYKLVLPRVKTGGVLLADNVLFHGEVLEEKISGKNAQAIQRFNEYVQKDAMVENVLLTMRDGILFIVKK
jgi:caffeoyl-CoA O-methyltransferase